MSRGVRINELVLRELSDLLHTRYRDQAVKITITEAMVAPDLRSARIFYSVLGDAAARLEAEALLEEIKHELRTRLGKRVVLKYNPVLEFAYDDSLERGNRTLAILDDLAARGEFVERPAEPELTPMPLPDPPPEPRPEPRRPRSPRPRAED